MTGATPSYTVGAVDGSHHDLVLFVTLHHIVAPIRDIASPEAEEAASAVFMYKAARLPALKVISSS